MFKLGLSPTYFWAVTVELPGATGVVEKHAFDAEFRRLPASEIGALQRDAASGAIDDNVLLGRVMVGWRGVEDEDGSPLPFTPGNRDRLLDVHPVRPALVRAWFESLEGARRKNS